MLQLSLSLVRTKVESTWDSGNKIVRGTKIKLSDQLECGVYTPEGRIKGESSAGPLKPSLQVTMGLLSSSLGGSHSAVEVQALRGWDAVFCALNPKAPS